MKCVCFLRVARRTLLELNDQNLCFFMFLLLLESSTEVNFFLNNGNCLDFRRMPATLVSKISVKIVMKNV